MNDIFSQKKKKKVNYVYNTIIVNTRVTTILLRLVDI